MNGLGSGSLFGKQGTQQGTGFGTQSQTPPAGGFGLNAKRTQSFTTPGTSTGPFGASNTNTGGLLGQNKSSGGLFGNSNQSGGVFGAGTSTPTGTSSTNTGLFGSNNAGTTRSTGLFGSGTSNTTPQNSAGSGGLFGSNTDTSNPGSGGLFGSNTNTQSSTGGLFGSNVNNQTNPSSGGLFGSNTNNQGSSSTGGLFGSNNQANTSTGGSFGSSTNNQTGAGSGSLFGSNTNSQANTSSGGLFGSNANNQPNPGSGGLFGSSSANSQAGNTSGLFGGSGAANSAPGPFGQSSNTGGLFGSGTTGSGTTGSSSLFGGNSNTGSTGIFGKSTTGTNTQAAGAGTSSMFSAPASQAPQQQQQQPLIATIEQASFTLPGVAPSQKLYTSLSVQGSKRSAHDTDIYNYEPKMAAVPKSRPTISKIKNLGGKQDTQLKTSKASVSIAGPLSSAQGLTASGSLATAAKAQGEPRKWINSYANFVRERPTTLLIKRSGRKMLADSLPSVQKVPVAAAPPSITAAADSTVSVSHIADSTSKADLAASQAVPNTNEADVSLFHRQANNMTLVRVNKRAIEEGYYIHPRLEDLAAMSKSQLAAVDNLVIGRENFGQIEYPGKVDLSRIANLGDILGSLVVIGPGTVCVYPDEEAKAAPGRELNLPCTVTIENAWPKDSHTHAPIKDMEDPRMIKHIQKLRRACESRGGEFVTFAQGIWVFKVPHFSTWGLPAEEMIVEYDDEDPVLVLKGSQNPPYSASASAGTSAGAVDSIYNDKQAAESFENVDDDEMNAESFYGTEDVVKPQTWLDQLTHASNGVLLAAAESLDAASKPTADLDLEDILNPAWKKDDAASAVSMGDSKDEEELKHAKMASFESKAAALRSNALCEHIRKQVRPDSNLPLLQTSIDFGSLANFTRDNRDLWDLLGILYDGKVAEPLSDGVDAPKLAAWFDTKVSSEDTNFQGDALDTIWQLVCKHKVKEAFGRAVTSNNIHLALLIALLDGRSTNKNGEGLSFDAEHQLNDWKATRTQQSIPKTVKRVWELAAKRVPAGAGLTWAEWIGVHLWYFGSTSLQPIVAALPNLYTAGTKDRDLMFLQFAAGTKQLRTAVGELDLVDSFLCLQAMLKNNASAVKADVKLYDGVCVKLAEAFEQNGDSSSAVFAALHIIDSKLATRTARSILQNAPVTVSLPLDFGVPEQFLDESRAFQVARSGEYVAQAEYLIRAGLYADGHKIIISTVGPEAVLNNRTDQILGLLQSLEQNKDKFSGWNTGGFVYLTYASALAQAPDLHTSMALCNACRYVATPTLKSKKAVSRIAEFVAATPFAAKTISSQMILRMKFDPSQAKVQAMQEAARLLS